MATIMKKRGVTATTRSSPTSKRDAMLREQTLRGNTKVAKLAKVTVDYDAVEPTIELRTKFTVAEAVNVVKEVLKRSRKLPMSEQQELSDELMNLVLANEASLNTKQGKEHHVR